MRISCLLRQQTSLNLIVFSDIDTFIRGRVICLRCLPLQISLALLVSYIIFLLVSHYIE